MHAEMPRAIWSGPFRLSRPDDSTLRDAAREVVWPISHETSGPLWAPRFSARGGLTRSTRDILASLGSEMPRAEWCDLFRLRHSRSFPATPTSSAEDDEGYEHVPERCPGNVVISPSWRKFVRFLLPWHFRRFLQLVPRATYRQSRSAFWLRLCGSRAPAHRCHRMSLSRSAEPMAAQRGTTVTGT